MDSAQHLHLAQQNGEFIHMNSLSLPREGVCGSVKGNEGGGESVVHEAAWRRGETTDLLISLRAGRGTKWRNGHWPRNDCALSWRPLLRGGWTHPRDEHRDMETLGKLWGGSSALEAEEMGAPVMKATASQPIASGAIRRANRRG